MSKARKISYCILSVTVFGLFVWYCVIACPTFLTNLWRAITALFESFAYYIEFMISGGTPAIEPSISTIPQGIESQLPITWSEFTVVVKTWWNELWTWDNVVEYFKAIITTLGPLLQFLAIALPVIVCLTLLLRRFSIPKTNVKRGASVPLKAWLWVETKIFKPSYKYVKDLVLFNVNNKYVRYAYILTFLLFFNVIAVGIELFSFLFYFVTSFDFLALYTVFARTVCNLASLFKLPLWVCILPLWVMFLRYRRRRAMRFLNALESFNVKFIKELPIVSMSVGTMGSKKTTQITDMAKSACNIFREHAKSTMLEKSLLFPNFNWRLFEDELLACFSDGTIWSLRSARSYVSSLKAEFLSTGDVGYLFGYDVSSYSLERYDGLRNVSVWKAMEDYAQCFFIYTRKSITVSNYAIKENSRIEFIGNSPVVTSDFQSDVREGEYCHVINFDALRLGKKYKDGPKDRRRRPFFDFGIIVVSEAGKERGNMLDTRGQKKDDEKVNQLNDLFNDFIKLIRHRCTVDYFPYAMVFFDDQRPESLGADCRELAYINQIAGSSELRLSMPFFWVEELLHDWLYPKYADYQEEYNFYSGKTTLRYYVYTKLVALVHNYYVSVYNRYGYYALTINQQSGKMDGKIIEKYYYLSRKKIYSDTFATDCYGEYLVDDTSKRGIDSLPYYVDVKASKEELDMQESHLVRNKLKKYGHKARKGGEKNEKENSL